MSYCVCLACPTNARPGGVGTSKTRPIRSNTNSSLRVIYVLDGVVADTALCTENLVACSACYMYAKHVHADEMWLHAGEGLQLDDRLALATMEYVLSRAAGSLSPAHLSCVLRAVFDQLQSVPVSAQAPPPDFVTGLLALAELLSLSTCTTAEQLPNFGELKRLPERGAPGLTSKIVELHSICTVGEIIPKCTVPYHTIEVNETRTQNVIDRTSPTPGTRAAQPHPAQGTRGTSAASPPAARTQLLLCEPRHESTRIGEHGTHARLMRDTIRRNQAQSGAITGLTVHYGPGPWALNSCMPSVQSRSAPKLLMVDAALAK